MTYFSTNQRVCIIILSSLSLHSRGRIQVFTARDLDVIANAICLPVSAMEGAMFLHLHKNQVEFRVCLLSRTSDVVLYLFFSVDFVKMCL